MSAGSGSPEAACGFAAEPLPAGPAGGSLGVLKHTLMRASAWLPQRGARLSGSRQQPHSAVVQRVMLHRGAHAQLRDAISPRPGPGSTWPVCCELSPLPHLTVGGTPPGQKLQPSKSGLPTAERGTPGSCLLGPPEREERGSPGRRTAWGGGWQLGVNGSSGRRAARGGGQCREDSSAGRRAAWGGGQHRAEQRGGAAGLGLDLQEYAKQMPDCALWIFVDLRDMVPAGAVPPLAPRQALQEQTPRDTGKDAASQKIVEGKRSCWSLHITSHPLKPKWKGGLRSCSPVNSGCTLRWTSGPGERENKISPPVEQRWEAAANRAAKHMTDREGVSPGA